MVESPSHGPLRAPLPIARSPQRPSPGRLPSGMIDRTLAEEVTTNRCGSSSSSPIQKQLVWQGGWLSTLDPLKRFFFLPDAATTPPAPAPLAHRRQVTILSGADSTSNPSPSARARKVLSEISNTGRDSVRAGCAGLPRELDPAHQTLVPILATTDAPSLPVHSHAHIPTPLVLGSSRCTAGMTQRNSDEAVSINSETALPRKIQAAGLADEGTLASEAHKTAAQEREHSHELSRVAQLTSYQSTLHALLVYLVGLQLTIGGCNVLCTLVLR